MTIATEITAAIKAARNPKRIVMGPSAFAAMTQAAVEAMTYQRLPIVLTEDFPGWVVE